MYPRFLFRTSKLIIYISIILSVNFPRLFPHQFRNPQPCAVSRLPIVILHCARSMKTKLLFTSSGTKRQMTIWLFENRMTTDCNDIEHCPKILANFKVKQKSWFWGCRPKWDNKNKPCATKIKNITPVVYS